MLCSGSHLSFELEAPWFESRLYLQKAKNNQIRMTMFPKARWSLSLLYPTFFQGRFHPFSLQLPPHFCKDNWGFCFPLQHEYVTNPDRFSASAISVLVLTPPFVFFRNNSLDMGRRENWYFLDVLLGYYHLFEETVILPISQMRRGFHREDWLAWSCTASLQQSVYRNLPAEFQSGWHCGRRPGTDLASDTTWLQN